MLDSRDIGGLQGAPVTGTDGDRLGSVSQVFLDPVTESPNWVTVRTGLFGHKETFIPLANATWDGEQLHVDVDKETLKDAPRIDADEALTPHNEEALYRYYGLSDRDTDGGTARPDEYPEREYTLSPDGETVTPAPTDADGRPIGTAPDRDTDAPRRGEQQPRDLRLSEQPLAGAQPGSTTPVTAPVDRQTPDEHSGKHARLRRHHPADEDAGPAHRPGTGKPTIDRSVPPRDL